MNKVHAHMTENKIRYKGTISETFHNFQTYMFEPIDFNMIEVYTIFTLSVCV